MREPAGLDTKRLFLTLRELEAATCLWLTWLLTFNSTWVTCDEAFCAQSLLVFFVDLHECTGDSEAKCLALTCITATCEVSLDVILLNYTEEVEGLLHDELNQF